MHFEAAANFFDLHSRAAVLREVRENGTLLKYLPEAIRNDVEVAYVAVSSAGQALEYVSADLRADRRIVLAAVRQTGWSLMYASEEMRADREVVLAAVRQDGSALWYASEELTADREVVLAAVKQKGWALMYAAEELRQDREIVYAAWCRDHQALTYASEVMRSKTPRFRFMSGEELELMSSVCGGSHVVEVKRQIETELHCRVELIFEGKRFADQEDRPLAMLGDMEIQIVKLPGACA
mmetsp:Transcript_116823/g.337530  ORF Transcript_116823/g.337530 Transcript_116823/m.337530 type:complete len:239 (-) Transcript_116823:131-847(-)